MDEFDGKVAVVTGAASGIGRALAQRAATEGMKLVLADIEEDPLKVAAEELRELGVDVSHHVVDVSNPDMVDHLGRQAMDVFGAVHLVFNNAGVSTGGRSWELSLKDWDWVLGVNLWGVIHGVRTFTPLVIQSGGGHIVNTASMAGLMSPPYMGPYNVSKFGVVALSEALFHELSVEHPEVGVSVLCPGWVNTRIHEADRNRPGTEDDAPDDTGLLAGADVSPRDFVGALIANGLAPADVADDVFTAVVERRFWVFTHDEWMESVKSRLERVAQGENPELRLPGVL